MIKQIYKKNVPLHIREWIHDIKLDFLNSEYYPPTFFGLRSHPLLMHKSARLIALKQRYQGKRCFIMGNGPSLNQMDLNLLDGEYVWASNRSYLLFNQLSWLPKFFIAVDKRVVPDIANDLNKLSSELNETLFFYPTIFYLTGVLSPRENVYWYHEKRQNRKFLPHGMFSINPVNYVRSVNTVTIAALQLAVFLGFNPIYLIGCDTSYKIPESVKFEDGNKKEIISTEDDDPNHFSAMYFGKGRKWHDPNVEAMIFHYQQAELVCRQLGVKVFNATVGGNLEVFERVDFTRLFIP